MCEILSGNPHPNICPYYGVVLDDEDRVIGITYNRYTQDLQMLLANGEAIDVDHIVNSVRRGMMHMHRLGLVHCDICAENILSRGEKL